MKTIEVRKLVDWLNYLFTRRGKQLVDSLADLKAGRWDRRASSGIREDLSYLSQMAFVDGIISKSDLEELAHFADALDSREEIPSSETVSLAKTVVSEYLQTLEEHLDTSALLVHSMKSRLPSQFLNLTEKLSYDLHSALRDFVRGEQIGTELRVMDFIRYQSVAHNITEIAKDLQKEFLRGYSVSNVWRIVNKLAERRLIETVGGRRSGKRYRYCFANITTLGSRGIMDSKEEIIDGTVSTNLVPRLDFSKTFTFGINVYEFNSNLIPRIYVISPHALTDGLRVKTIGTFFEGGLESQLEKRYQIRFKQESSREEYGQEDALVAYVHMMGEEIIWFDKDSSRAIVFT